MGDILDEHMERGLDQCSGCGKLVIDCDCTFEEPPPELIWGEVWGDE